MLNEKKEKGPSKDGKQISGLLMKPFSLGWTREVVRRVITKNGTPNCDIYYFSPSGKKIRSLTEVKSHLTDGLSAECFSFKREPLGLESNFETVRNARVRRKAGDKSIEKGISLRGGKKLRDNSETEVQDSTKENKKRKSETDQEESPKINETDEKRRKYDMQGDKEKEEKENMYKQSENRQRRVKSGGNDSQESKNYNRRKKTKTKVEKLTKRTSSVRSQTIRRKEVLKKIKSVKQAKVVPGKKILKKVVRKKVTASNKRKLSTNKDEKETITKKSKSKLISQMSTKKEFKTKTDKAKEVESTETDKKSEPTDLKSIVKNNIGKYREMREKQKLGVIKLPVRGPSKKIVVGGTSRTRSEPISKNKIFYLKPLENGWRRELVFRTNCARAGQQADVYYFHPNGKKLRSCREISENLTHGLSIDCFTFRKEPIGCGEPFEVIRNARSNQKN